MWKIVVGFVLFAALALFVLSRGGDIDMSGEKHGDTSHIAPPAAEASAPATPAPAVAASAATAPTEAASASK